MTSLSYVLDVVKADNCTSPRSVESLSGLKQLLRNELIGQEEGKKKKRETVRTIKEFKPI